MATFNTRSLAAFDSRNDSATMRPAWWSLRFAMWCGTIQTSEGTSVASAITKDDKHATTPRGQSQWGLIAREFRKRRLAVAASFVILLLVTVSIFAPLLANDRPIYYVGFNRFEYQEAARTLRGAIGQLIEARSKSAPSAPQRPGHRQPVQSKIDELTKAARLQIDLMSAALPPEKAAKLRDLGRRVHEGIVQVDLKEAVGELKALQRELRSEFDGRDVTLVTRSHWPVFASLIWSDIAFLVANLLVLAWPIWSRMLRRWEGHSGDGANSWWYAAILAGLPLACGLVWWCVVPQRVDRTNYKSGVLVSEDAEKKAPAVFQSVMWPPVAFGLDENDLAGKTQAPAWYKQAKVASDRKPLSAWSGPHWLGTDELGRDILCRMIWGGRVSLSVGIVAVAIYVSIGIVIGSLAGYFRGACDLVVSRIIEVVICFPAFFLILTIVAMVGPGLFNIMVVIGLTGWTGIARLVRGEFLRLVDQEFVLAGRALGYSPLRIIFRHVLPNALAPVLVSATFGVAGAILTESALSFLGLGITVPTPSWGGILADGRQALLRAPWLIHFPGLAIFVTITSYNLVGEALRDAADPRLRGSR